MAQTKGIGFHHVQAFVRQRHGEETLRELVASLPAADQEVVRSAIAVGWYDLAVYARLLAALEKMCGRGDGAVVETLGRYEAEQDVTTIQRWLLRLFHPSFAIEQMGKYWSKFHDTGTWTIAKNGERELAAELADWGIVDALSCRELLGYLGRTLELISKHDVRIVHTKCRARGDAVCAFHADWRVVKATEPPPGR